MLFAKTPHPGLTDLLPSLIPKKPAGVFFHKKVLICMNGRNALFHALSTLNIKKGHTVLMPAFHCPAMVDPIFAYGASVKYYNVRRNLAIDLNEIENLVTRDVAAILYVNFFGFPAPFDSLNDISQRKSIPLIEDCCHALFSKIGNQYLGHHGAVSIFSFRKTLPVEDGGALVINNPGNYYVFPRFRSPLQYHIRMLKWSLEKILQHPANFQHRHIEPEVPAGSVPLKSVPNYHKGPDSHDDREFVPEWRNWSISWPSKWLLAKSNADKIRNKRAENYTRLHAQLQHINIIQPCFPHLPDGICPLGYAFTTEFNRRLDYELRRYGIPAFSFGEFLHETLPQANFQDARYLSRHLTILPIHQDLTSAQIDRMADLVEQVIKKRIAGNSSGDKFDGKGLSVNGKR